MITEATTATPTPLLNEKQVSKMLNVSVGFVRKIRNVGTGPAVIRLGDLIRYQQSDIERYIESNTKSN